MAQRIVQLLVTMAVDTGCPGDAVRDEVADALTIVGDEVIVELAKSRRPRTPAGTHARQPRRMSGRQLLPSLCSCGEPWPCKVATAEDVGQFQVHADEEGDLRLLCPRAEDLGCLFAAEVLSGATLAQITEKARAHTGDEAESAHDFIRTINGESESPAGQEG